MLVGCPECKTKYRLDDSRLTTDRIILRCSRCRTLFRVAGKIRNTVQTPASVSEYHVERPITVVVANESPDFCAAVERVLSSELFTVLSRHDGSEAMTLIEEITPDVVLLDVALPGMYGFEICDRIRTIPALSSVKTILIASIYDKTRYKREPKSLYGADDYIEKHHIPDSLCAKICRLVFGQQQVDTAEGAGSPGEEAQPTDLQSLSGQEMNDQEAVREELRRDEEAKTSGDECPEREAAHAKARRLARIIVADIALYNQKRVEEAVCNRTFYELFAEEVEEGRRLYGRRVPEEVRQGTRYLEDAFEEFIAKKRADYSASESGLTLTG